MRDEVGAGREQRLRVGEIEEVSGDAESALVSLVDDGAIHLGRHLLRGAEVVVDTDLDDVDFLRGDSGHLRARLVRRGGREHGPGDEHPRAIEGGRVLLGARGEHGRRLAAKRVDGRDAVRGVGAQVRGRVDVAVRVDEPGDDGLPIERDARGAGGNGDTASRSGGNDAPIPNDDGRIRDRRAVGAVDERGASERLCLRLRRTGVGDQE